MKKLLFILIIIPFFGFGQTNCKFHKNEVDDMTGEELIVCRGVLLCNEFLGMGMWVIPKKINGKFFLNFSFGYPDEYSINNENKIIIKLVNKELITLKINEEMESKEVFNGVGYTYDGNINVEISKENLKNIVNKDIDKIRIYFKSGFSSLSTKVSKRWLDGYWEKDNFNSKKRKKLTEQINCLLLESEK